MATPQGRAVRRAVVLDAVVALAVFAYNLPVQGLTTGPAGAWLPGVLVPIGLCVPWVLHRSRPVTALALMLSAAVLQTLLGTGPLVADVMLALGLHAVARRREWRTSVAAALVVAGWAVVSFAPRLGEDRLSIGDLGVFVAVAVGAWLSGTLARTRAAYVDSLRQRVEQSERERETQARLAAVAERTRIARELHDLVSHHLGAIGFLSDGAAAVAADDPARAAETMRTVRDTSRAAMTEMRSMLSVLRDDAATTDLPAPGLDDLDDLVVSARAAGLPVTLRRTGGNAVLAAAPSLAVYRIVQESLTNVRKHAGPDVRTIRVDLHVDPGGVRLDVVDDGAGPVDGVRPGHGLVGMRERTAALGGSVETGTRAGGGFAVRVRLPAGTGA